MSVECIRSVKHLVTMWTMILHRASKMFCLNMILQRGETRGIFLESTIQTLILSLSNLLNFGPN